MALRLTTGTRNALLGDATDKGSFKDIFDLGVMRIYSGPQPASAEDIESGTLLLEVSVGAAAFVAGLGTNGLSFGAPSGGVLAKAAESWQGVGLADNTAGWFRFYAKDRETGAVSTALRFDGNCGTSGANLNMGSTNITTSATHTIDSFQITLPAA